MNSDITVVIPTIPGREDLFLRALISVHNQTLAPEDIIVINDTKRHGAAWSRNEGVKSVTTKWIAFLDDDDEMLPRHLETLLRAARKTDADLIYPYMEVVGGRDPLAVSLNGNWVLPFGVTFGPEQEHHLRRAGNFIPITYLVRTSLVKNVNGFPEAWTSDNPREEDYGLLLKLLDAGAKFIHVPKRTWRYHIHSSNTGGRGQ